LNTWLLLAEKWYLAILALSQRENRLFLFRRNSPVSSNGSDGKHTRYLAGGSEWGAVLAYQ
jgi:hypothetical protein